MDTQLYKTLLETERDELMNDLKGMSVKDAATGEYSVTSDTSETEADDSDLDDRNEEFETDSAIADELSPRLKEVEDALSRIESGNYGTCSVCGNQIEEERLQANPAATTCVADMNS